MFKYFIVARNTTLEELEARKKALAKKHHPDVPGGNTRIMQDISNEYMKAKEQVAILQKLRPADEHARETIRILIDYVIDHFLPVPEAIKTMIKNHPFKNYCINKINASDFILKLEEILKRRKGN